MCYMCQHTHTQPFYTYFSLCNPVALQHALFNHLFCGKSAAFSCRFSYCLVVRNGALKLPSNARHGSELPDQMTLQSHHPQRISASGKTLIQNHPTKPLQNTTGTAFLQKNTTGFWGNFLCTDNWQLHQPRKRHRGEMIQGWQLFQGQMWKTQVVGWKCWSDWNKSPWGPGKKKEESESSFPWSGRAGLVKIKV